MITGYKDFNNKEIFEGSVLLNYNQEYKVSRYLNENSPYYMQWWIYNLNNEKDNQLLTNNFCKNSLVVNDR